MPKIQIICSSPGMRRHGAVHPASAIYDEGKWTDTQLQAFRDDPAFTVLAVADGGGVLAAGTDIEASINARVEVIREEMQKSFNKAVSDGVAEKLDSVKAEVAEDYKDEISALAKDLASANGKVDELTTSVAALTTALDEAKAKAPKK